VTSRKIRVQAGFTLVELLIVVAIVAILANIALPTYSDYITRSKLSEAQSYLSAMRTKVEQYYLDQRTYVGACAAGTVAPLPTAAEVKYFTYSCPSLTATTYTVQATGVSAQGTGGFSFSINELNAKATTAVPAGWTANGSCWVTKKDGSC